MKPAERVPPLLTRDDVAQLLGVELRKLTWWFWALNRDRRYREFDVLKRNGDARVIAAPIKPIKDIQQALAKLLSDWYGAPPHVHGFTTGRDPRSNAQPHRRQQWVMRVDIADFFPSINFGRVRGLFMAFPFEFPDAVATLLAQICCHRNALPQGAPTSPVVSNFICRGLDRRLSKLAQAERCYMTRYADDITLSTDRTVFPQRLGFLDGSQAMAGGDLVSLVESEGFKLNPTKTRLVRRWQRQRVTGLVVNRQLNVPRTYVRGLRALLYVWERYGEDAAFASFLRAGGHINWPPNKPQPDLSVIVAGQVKYVGSVKGWNDAIYQDLATHLASVSSEFTYRRPPLNVIAVRVVTEGDTDCLHLRAALKNFQAKGEFLELDASFDTDYEGEGDSALGRYVRSLPSELPSVPTVCLFDRDNERLLREQGLLQQDFDDRGNGVAAAALVAPRFRTAPFCVEMLYEDEVLARQNEEGRRVYLLTEFNEATRHHVVEQCSLATPQVRTLVRSDVFEFNTGRSLALSKTDFAALVAGEDEPFKSLEFEGFRPTFDMLLRGSQDIAEKVDARPRRGA